MSYVACGSISVGPHGQIVVERYSPPKAPAKPPPPKLVPQACYAKDEHEVLVDKCRGLSGFGEFESAYLKAITKTFACEEAAKPICQKTPPPKPGLRAPVKATPKAPPPKPKISSTRPASTTASASAMPVSPEIPMYATAPAPPAPYFEEAGISKTAIIVGVVGVAAVTGVLYMVFR